MFKNFHSTYILKILKNLFFQTVARSESLSAKRRIIITVTIKRGQRERDSGRHCQKASRSTIIQTTIDRRARGTVPADIKIPPSLSPSSAIFIFRATQRTADILLKKYNPRRYLSDTWHAPKKNCQAIQLSPRSFKIFFSTRNSKLRFSHHITPHAHHFSDIVLATAGIVHRENIVSLVRIHQE